MSEFQWVCAAIVAAFSTARLTRLFVFDSYPPSAWLRMKWEDRVPESWAPLMTCGYCFGVYAAAFVLGTGWLSWWLAGELVWAWWLFHGWMALSYAGSIIVAFDGDD